MSSNGTISKRPPERSRHSTNWRTFLASHKSALLATDFLTVETFWLKTVYILFFMELHTRRVYVAGCTSEPTSAWVTWVMQEQPSPVRFLIHDRDSKFSSAFEAVFVSESIEIILTPPQAPNANAYAERWVRTVREECLDHLLIFGEQHLLRLLKEYVIFYNNARPYQGLEQQAPIPFALRLPEGSIRRHDVLGGLIHDYYREAA